jgi:hypothetical protein
MPQLDFVAERENWNLYSLEDGTRVRTRLVMTAIRQDGVDDQRRPKYQVETAVIVHIEHPETIDVPSRG